MSTTYPQSIDSFYRPANGQDYVKAEHVYNMQDALRAVQVTLVGSGLDVNFDTSYVVPSDSSFKHAIETLDNQLSQTDDSASVHRSLSLLTDTAQHHANIIEISTPPSLDYINPPRVQTALEVIRNEINTMLSGDEGTNIRGMHLQNTYVRREGLANIDGQLTVSGATSLQSDVNLGASTSHITTIAGACSIGGTLSVANTSTFNESIQIAADKVLGLTSNLTYSGISFSEELVALKSMKDIVLTIDSNGATDGLGQTSKFEIRKHLGDVIFSISELGILSLAGALNCPSSSFSTEVSVGSLSPLKISDEKIALEKQSLSIALDTEDALTDEKFVITKDGYSGDDVNSSSVLLKVLREKIYTGTTMLLPGLIEDGNFGLKTFSRNATGEFYGCWVPFRQEKTVVPGSVAITLDPGCQNINTVQVGQITKHGFFIEADSTEVGAMYLFGTYQA